MEKRRRCRYFGGCNAEAGQFDDAAKWQALAVQLKGDTPPDGYEARLAMYKKREPFRTDHLATWFF